MFKRFIVWILQPAEISTETVVRIRELLKFDILWTFYHDFNAQAVRKCSIEPA